MYYKTNGRLDDNEAIYINKISKNNVNETKKVYRIKKDGKYRNIIEEKDTIYEIDNDCIEYCSKKFKNN